MTKRKTPEHEARRMQRREHAERTFVDVLRGLAVAQGGRGRLPALSGRDCVDAEARGLVAALVVFFDSCQVDEERQLRAFEEGLALACRKLRERLEAAGETLEASIVDVVPTQGEE